MKRKKIIVIVVTVIVVLILGTWFSWHCVNMIAQKKLDEIAAEYEPIDIPAERRQQAYKIGEDVLFYIDHYNNGANPSQCLEMLQIDYDQLIDLSEDENLSEVDKLLIDAMATDTAMLIRKVKALDYDTASIIDNLEQFMGHIKDQGLPEDKE